MSKEYNIYRIKYTDPLGRPAIAGISAESSKEAENMLEKSVVEGKGYYYMKGKLFPETEESGFRVSIKGIVVGYDELSNSFLD